jgi:hypothetical protein
MRDICCQTAILSGKALDYNFLSKFHRDPSSLQNKCSFCGADDGFSIKHAVLDCKSFTAARTQHNQDVTTRKNRITLGNWLSFMAEANLLSFTKSPAAKETTTIMHYKTEILEEIFIILGP